MTEPTIAIVKPMGATKIRKMQAKLYIPSRDVVRFLNPGDLIR